MVILQEFVVPYIMVNLTWKSKPDLAFKIKYTIHLCVNYSSETKISYFCHSLMKKYICWFNISMDDFLFIEFFESFYDMFNKYGCFQLTKPFLLLLIHVILQVSISTILHKHIQIIACSRHIEQFYNIRMIYLLQDSYLSLDEFNHFRSVLNGLCII